MENRYTLQDFIGLLAASSGQSKRKSEAYLRALFDVIQKGLEEDQFVKVRGFGTFKVAQVSERESVNVATGERFTLGSHAKITFLPDATLKELVNRPFAHFTTITLEEDTDLEALERIGQDATGADAAPAGIQEAATSVPESGGEPEPANKEPEKGPEEPAQPVAEPEESVAAPAAEKEESPAAPAPQPEADARQTAAPASVEDDFMLPSHPEAPVQPEYPHEPEAHITRRPEDDREEAAAQPPASGRLRRIGKFAAAGLVLLVLTLSSYFVGYFRILCPDCDIRPAFLQNPARQAEKKPRPAQSGARTAQTKKKSRPESSPRDSLTAEKTDSLRTPAPKKPTLDELYAVSRNYEQVPGGHYLITGTEGTHTVTIGENIYRIAKKHYGQKSFARYIIVHNRLDNPDVITLGAILRLPELTEIPQADAATPQKQKPTHP